MPVTISMVITYCLTSRSQVMSQIARNKRHHRRATRRKAESVPKAAKIWKSRRNILAAAEVEAVVHIATQACWRPVRVWKGCGNTLVALCSLPSM